MGHVRKVREAPVVDLLLATCELELVLARLDEVDAADFVGDLGGRRIAQNTVIVEDSYVWHAGDFLVHGGSHFFHRCASESDPELRR